MELDLERLFVISVLIAVVGGIVGGIRCAILEHSLLGKPDTTGIFRTQRITAELAALVVGSGVGYMGAAVAERAMGISGLLPLFLGGGTGIIVHYVVHTTVYSMLLKTR